MGFIKILIVELFVTEKKRAYFTGKQALWIYKIL